MRKESKNEFSGVGKERTHQSGELEHNYHREQLMSRYCQNKSTTPSTSI